MHPVKATFARLRDVPVAAILGEIGVYVIWDAKSDVIPAYIGHGNILRRIVDHTQKKEFRLPFDGYAAIPYDCERREAVPNAKILEAMLLEIAFLKSRGPRVNRQRGHNKEIFKMFQRHRTVRATLSGYDPFSPPWQPRILDERKKCITIVDDGEQPSFAAGWQKLRTKS